MDKNLYDEPNGTDQADEYIAKRLEQYNNWRDDLRAYWPLIERNQEMQQFYKSEYSETSSDVSFNSAFSMIETMVAKANDSTLDAKVLAKGVNGLEEFEEYTSGALKAAIEDPDVATFKGTARKVREVWLRDKLGLGNAVAEMGYLYKTGMYLGKKTVLADNPYTENRSIFKLVFNPASYMDSSYRYYMEKHVTFQSLKDQEEKEVEERDEKGEKKKRKEGLYKNLGLLKERLRKENKVVDDNDLEQDNIIGDSKISRKVEPIRLLEIWDGPKLCVIAVTSKSGGVIIREVYDPLKIGRHPFLIGMRYKFEGRPYAYGEIDAIYKTARAQDTVLNQSIESVNRYLRPSLFVADRNADLDSIATVMEYGGVDYGDPAGMAPLQASPPPAQAFQLHDLLRQGVQSAGRFSTYASGITNDTTDKTAGTASGIKSLQAAAEPNFKMILDDIQESYTSPQGRAYFKMIGNLMGEHEIRDTLLRGKNAGWVKATKGIMTGKVSIGDLVTIGFIKQEELQDPAFLSELFAQFDIQDPQINPAELEKTIMFDVDLIVDVTLDDQSEADREQKVREQAGWISSGMQTGVPINPEKAWKYVGQKLGYEDAIEEILYTPEELQQQQAQQEQQMQQQQQQELQAEMMKKQADQQGQMASQNAQNEATMRQKQLEVQSRLQQEQMRQSANMSQGMPR